METRTSIQNTSLPSLIDEFTDIHTTSTAHLWVGTSRGVIFTLTVNPSDDAASSCSVGGSLFRLEGEAVSVAFLDSLGEICVPPATKWDLGSSAIPRLTLVPQQEEEDCVDGGATRMLADQESGFGDSLKPTAGTCSVSVAKRLGPGAPASTGAHLTGSTAPPTARRDQPAKGAGRWSALKLSACGSGGSSPATPGTTYHVLRSHFLLTTAKKVFMVLPTVRPSIPKMSTVCSSSR
nr:unnamed protein product [Spirometra erinaceieuropaei]